LASFCASRFNLGVGLHSHFRFHRIACLAGGIGKGTNDSVGWRSSVDCHTVVGHIVCTDDGISKHEMQSSLKGAVANSRYAGQLDDFMKFDCQDCIRESCSAAVAEFWTLAALHATTRGQIMEQNKPDSKCSRQSFAQALSLGIGIGAGVGTAIGVAMHSMAIGIGIGAGVAVAFTFAFGGKKCNKDAT
jgi:hypothetical protein